MKLYQLIVTKNECYLSGRPLAPKGIMVHSTGANNPKLSRYVGPDDGRLGKNPMGNHWNQLRPEGRQICCHAFIGKLADGTVATYQILPWTMRGWHGASGPKGSVNDTHIGFECCEDGLDNKAYFQEVYQEATDLCAHLCKQFHLTAKDVIDHHEGYLRGVASNHGDITHWLKRYGLTMNDFRATVQKKLDGNVSSQGGAQKPAEPAALGAQTKPGNTESTSEFKENDRVRIQTSAAYYYPGGKPIQDWIKTRSYTVNAFQSIGGVPCARLAEISSWCAVNFLTRA
jgi:hypothetical protein